MNCPQCGAPAQPNAAFCDNCGASLAAAPQQPVAAAPAQPAAPAGSVACQNCGHLNVAGAAFCEDCGVQLPQGPSAVPTYPPPPAPQPYSPPTPQPVIPQPYTPPAATFVTGRLVVQPSNTSLPIPPNLTEVIIGREDPVSNVFPHIDTEQHGGHDAGVGRQHAKLIVQNGQVCLVDLNSVNHTSVNKQQLQPNQPRPLNNGDEIRLGKLLLQYFTS